MKRLEAMAPARALKVRIVAVRRGEELDHAFEQAKRTAQAVLVLADQNLEPRRVVALSVKHKLPDMHVVREFVDAGGLMAYAPDVAVMFRRAADYVDRILKGANPANLPIEEPSKLVFIVNLKAAKIIGLTIPASILLRADEVIR